MGRRKGEMSSAVMDREFPYQIIIPADWCDGSQYYTVQYFCVGLSVAPRTHSVLKDDRWHYVFCFREKADAEKFQQRFPGEWFDQRWSRLSEQIFRVR